jgi:hypothetical protein
MSAGRAPLASGRHCCPLGCLRFGFLRQFISLPGSNGHCPNQLGLSWFPAEGLAGDEVGRQEVQREQIP